MVELEPAIVLNERLWESLCERRVRPWNIHCGRHPASYARLSRAMPIKPENRHRYPDDWRALSDSIRFGRARRRCECRGECGYDDHAGKRCEARHGHTHPVTGSVVVLTVAHRDHDPETRDPAQLMAACQRCHNAYDREHRQRSAALTRIEKSGQLRFDWYMETV